MKLFVIEGLDNTGKTLFANNLKKYFINEKNIKESRIKYIHFIAPKAESFEKCAELSHKFSMDTVKDIVWYNKRNLYDIVILDRSWYSEYVYGQLYRERHGDDILKDIRDTEDVIINQFDLDDVYYVYLAGTPEFLIKYEDGKSLSNNNTELINTELSYFDELFDKYVMLSNSIKIEVNTSNTDFKSDKTILKELTDIVNI